MKRSVRLAARAHNIAIGLLLVCATALGALWIVTSVSPTLEGSTRVLVDLFSSLLAVGFVIMVATGFHIAVVDAVGRIERREKNSTSDESLE
jgi:hypothetical protein